jgi:hypothetical protein
MVSIEQCDQHAALSIYSENGKRGNAAREKANDHTYVRFKRAGVGSERTNHERCRPLLNGLKAGVGSDRILE